MLIIENINCYEDEFSAVIKENDGGKIVWGETI